MWVCYVKWNLAWCGMLGEGGRCLESKKVDRLLVV